MSSTPSIHQILREGRRVLLSEIGFEQHDDVVIDSANAADAGNTNQTWEIRGGVVLVETSTAGKFVNAANTSTGALNSSGVVSTQAEVTAAETADADWQSATITLTINGVAIVTVTLGGADDTDAEVVAALNGNATFRAHAIASVVDSLVVIKSLAKGAAVHLKVTSSLATAFGASGQEARGTDGNYVVMLVDTQVQDEHGTAQDAHVGMAAYAGHFDRDNLLGLTEDAERVLIQRGSRLEVTS